MKAEESVVPRHNFAVIFRVLLRTRHTRGARRDYGESETLRPRTRRRASANN